VPKIVKIGGCVLKLYPVKLGTFFSDALYIHYTRQYAGQTGSRHFTNSYITLV